MHGPQPKADDNKPKKLTEKLTAPLKMESVTIIFSMFRLVTVEILSYGVRYALIIAKMRVVKWSTCVGLDGEVVALGHDPELVDVGVRVASNKLVNNAASRQLLVYLEYNNRL